MLQFNILSPKFGHMEASINWFIHKSNKFNILHQFPDVKDHVFSTNVSWKLACTNSFHQKLTKYNVLDQVLHLKIILKQNIYSKSPINSQKHIFCVKKMCILSPNFGNKMASTNLIYHSTIKYKILDEITIDKLIP